MGLRKPCCYTWRLCLCIHDLRCLIMHQLPYITTKRPNH